MDMKKSIICGSLGVACLITALCSIRIVPTGETGIRVRLGQVQEETLDAGLHLKIPFIETIKKVNNKQIEADYTGQLWCESSEQVQVEYDGITLSYQISPSASVWLYKNVSANISTDSNALIPTTIVSSAMKNASIQLTTRDVTNRACIEPLAAKELQKALDEKYGEGKVSVVKLSIANANFEQEYNDVIAQRQAAQITYEKQQIENKTAIEKAEADAEKKRIDAEGEAEAMKAKAEGEAEAIKTQADAQAEANEKLQKSLTGEIITNTFIEKWNGELPKVQGSDGTIIDISELIKASTNSQNTVPQETTTPQAE